MKKNEKNILTGVAVAAAGFLAYTLYKRKKQQAQTDKDNKDKATEDKGNQQEQAPEGKPEDNDPESEAGDTAVSDKKIPDEKVFEEKLAEMQDRYLRLSAEFDNYRKRTLKEKMDISKYAAEDILKSILPVQLWPDSWWHELMW